MANPTVIPASCTDRRRTGVAFVATLLCALCCVAVPLRAQTVPMEAVVAVVDDQFTLKTLGHDKAGYCLMPANPEFDVIRPNGKLEIFGVVVGLVRRYP